MKATSFPSRDSISCVPRRLALLLIPLVLAWFAFSPRAQAACQRGCFTNKNTALGDDAVFSITTGIENTAAGFQALFSNTTGSDNTANGVGALYSNIDSGGNTANGARALYNNMHGTGNTASGAQALFLNTIGNNNIALGFNAGENLTTGSNNIDVGNAGVAGESNAIRIGTAGTHTATFIAGIRGTPIAGVPVGVTADGQLGVRGSSARFKEAIKPIDKASEAILALKPVTFRYTQEFDPDGIPQFGLVAEQVEKVNPDLIVRDQEGKPYTVRYEAVNTMLLNEFLKEHRKVQELEANAAKQQKQIEALSAGLQKVSAELELSKSTPQTVVNNR